MPNGTQKDIVAFDITDRNIQQELLHSWSSGGFCLALHCTPFIVLYFFTSEWKTIKPLQIMLNKCIIFFFKD